MADVYRVNRQTGEVYLLCEAAGGYVFIGNLNGRTFKEFKRDLQRAEEKENGRDPLD